MNATTTRAENQLLAALPPEELARWLPLLEPVELPLGKVLYESGRAIDHMYFPTTAIVSLLYVLADGHSAEFASVGREGVVGISLFMGGNSTPSRAVVQSAGGGFRLGAGVMKEAFGRSAPVMRLMLRYTQALITLTAQTAVCNRHHTLDERLSRWLLSNFDRVPGNELTMTQELIANMLGVRREGVTEAALRLQAAGLIQYARGRITVLDYHGLQRRACECYGVVKSEYRRLLPELGTSLHQGVTLPPFRGHFFAPEGVRDANPRAPESDDASSTEGGAGSDWSPHQRSGPKVLRPRDAEHVQGRAMLGRQDAASFNP
jgi:CRP-like cAMP-binding protein